MKKHSYTQEEIEQMSHDHTYIYSEKQEAGTYQLEVVKDPGQGRRLTMNLVRHNFSSAQEKKHASAAEFLELAVNSKQAKDAFLAKKSFTSSSKTGTQVYDHYMTGEEVLQPGKDYEIDVEVTLYEANNSTVGYTYGNKIMTWVNNKFFKNYTPGEIAGNMFHEWLHKLGYEHTSNNTAARPNSVPYWGGYLMRDLIDDHIAGRIKLIDLYPITVQPNPAEPPIVIPTPDPVVVRKKICKWTWQFWKGKVCYYE